MSDKNAMSEETPLLPPKIADIKDRLENLYAEINGKSAAVLNGDLIPELLDDAMALLSYTEHLAQEYRDATTKPEKTVQHLDSLERDELAFLSRIVETNSEIWTMEAAGIKSGLNLYISEIEISHDGDPMPYSIVPSEFGALCVTMRK